MGLSSCLGITWIRTTNRSRDKKLLRTTNSSPTDPDDFCTRFTGMAKVDSRQVYLCKTMIHALHCHQQATARGRTDSDSDVSTASESAARNQSESEPDEQTRAFFATYRKQALQY